MKRFQSDADRRLCFATIVLIGIFAVLLVHPFWSSFALAATSVFNAVVSFFGPDGEKRLTIFLVSMAILVIELVYMTSQDYMDRMRGLEKNFHRVKLN